MSANARTGRVRETHTFIKAQSKEYPVQLVCRAGETCSKHRVARLMRVNNLRALHGYRTRR